MYAKKFILYLDIKHSGASAYISQLNFHIYICTPYIMPVDIRIIQAYNRGDNIDST